MSDNRVHPEEGDDHDDDGGSRRQEQQLRVSIPPMSTALAVANENSKYGDNSSPSHWPAARDGNDLDVGSVHSGSRKGSLLTDSNP